MNLDNIQSVMVYQAVKFDNKLSTFFVTEDTTHQRACVIKIIPNIGVMLDNTKDCVIVPFPNISSIVMKTEHKTEQSNARKEDLANQVKPVKISKLKVDPVGAKRL